MWRHDCRVLWQLRATLSLAGRTGQNSHGQQKKGRILAQINGEILQHHSWLAGSEARRFQHCVAQFHALGVGFGATWHMVHGLDELCKH